MAFSASGSSSLRLSTFTLVKVTFHPSEITLIIIRISRFLFTLDLTYCEWLHEKFSVGLACDCTGL